jgi:hypothetical protein
MAVRTRGEKNSLVTVAACVTSSSRKKVTADVDRSIKPYKTFAMPT